jgi:hypothetical protein
MFHIIIFSENTLKRKKKFYKQKKVKKNIPHPPTKTTGGPLRKKNLQKG